MTSSNNQEIHGFATLGSASLHLFFEGQTGKGFSKAGLKLSSDIEVLEEK